jgi:carbon monoxide dehydrogenase subunit G
MEFKGQEKIAAPQETVWAYLTDPNKISECAPGLQSVEVIDDERFKMVVRVGVGPVRSEFDLTCTWTELSEPNRAKITAAGQAPGSAVTMDATMDLAPDGDSATVMDWAAEARISGKLAGLGSRLINPVADRMTKQVFECIRANLERPAS